jgi:hypothetical protein
MKTLLTFMMVALMGTSLFASGTDGDFVQTKEKAYFFKNVRRGTKSFLIGVKSDGTKVRFTKEEVTVFKIDGERFEKVPVVKDNVCTEDYCFMKVVAYKNGLKVYKHEYYDPDGMLTSRHYVFKNGEFVVKFDSKNTESLTAFFEGKNDN